MGLAGDGSPMAARSSDGFAGRQGTRPVFSAACRSTALAGTGLISVVQDGSPCWGRRVRSLAYDTSSKMVQCMPPWWKCVLRSAAGCRPRHIRKICGTSNLPNSLALHRSTAVSVQVLCFRCIDLCVPVEASKRQKLFLCRLTNLELVAPPESTGT